MIYIMSTEALSFVKPNPHARNTMSSKTCSCAEGNTDGKRSHRASIHQKIYPIPKGRQVRLVGKMKETGQVRLHVGK